jgi:hypothetical protein
VLAAILILTVGIIGVLSGFIASQKLSLVSERQSTMAHVAQREIERVEGLAYGSIGMTGTPSPSTQAQNPDYYVTSGSPPSFEWNRTSSSAEPLDIDTTNGTVAKTQSWSEGDSSGTIYDFVTWATDPNCGPGCPSSADYKRITVAVTLSSRPGPSPVYVSSLIVNPDAAPAQGTSNGTSGNPIANGQTTCAVVSGTTTTQGTCESPIDGGVPNTFFLHDCAATSASCSTPTGSNTLHNTVGVTSGLVCSTVTTTALVLGSIVPGAVTGCPTPDLIDPNPPAGGPSTPIYSYSTNVGSTTGYVGGRLLSPLCATNAICGTGSTSDCTSAAAWASSLLSAQNELWATAPVSTATTLTGEGALNLYTQTQNGTSAVVTLCVELYEIPPSGGIAGSLADLLAWAPTPLGGAAYVAATDPSTGSNWPTGPTDVQYEFNFASSGVTVPQGDRIGIRVWMVANVSNAIALLYDNPNYPSELQLNSQSAIQLSSN